MTYKLLVSMYDTVNDLNFPITRRMIYTWDPLMNYRSQCFTIRTNILFYILISCRRLWVFPALLYLYGSQKVLLKLRYQCSTLDVCFLRFWLCCNRSLKILNKFFDHKCLINVVLTYRSLEFQMVKTTFDFSLRNS